MWILQNKCGFSKYFDVDVKFVNIIWNGLGGTEKERKREREEKQTDVFLLGHGRKIQTHIVCAHL